MKSQYNSEEFACYCNDFWIGDDCSQPGLYIEVKPGQGQSCPLNCSGHGQCDDGTCICAEGYTGSGCQYETESHLPCENDCHKNGACHNGTCICIVGYSSSSNCLYKECPLNCSSQGYCHKGICMCELGWTGVNCSDPTQPDNNWYHFTFGKDKGPGKRLLSQMVTFSQPGKEDRIILVGGYSTGYVLDLWSLSPSNVEWKQIKVVNPEEGPCGREGHSVAIINNVIWLFGGSAFRPTKEKPSIPAPVDPNEPPPVSTDNGGSMADAMASEGGIDYENMNDLWSFDLITRKWTQYVSPGAAPVPRTRASLVAKDDNVTLYLFGGNMFKVQYAALNDLWVLDTSQDPPKWVEHPLCQEEEPSSGGNKEDSPPPAPAELLHYQSMALQTGEGSGTCPEDRYGHVAHWWRDRMVVFGGADGDTYFNDIWYFYPDANNGTGEWEHLSFDDGGLAPEKRVGHCAAIDNGDILVTMGFAGQGELLNDLWRFHFSTQEWENMEPAMDKRDISHQNGIPSPREVVTCSASASNLYIFGGRGFNFSHGHVIFDDLWVYDYDMIEGHTAGSDSIKVWMATYGGNCRVQLGQHTNVISNICNDLQICNVEVNNDLIPDPAIGCDKTLEVLYRCGKLEIDNVRPLYRYYSSQLRDHFYTSSSGELGVISSGIMAKYSFVSEGLAGLVWINQIPGTVPLYRYYNPRHVDHFYTTNPNEIATTTPGAKGRYGYICEGNVGFVFTQGNDLTVPLYRYWNPSRVDHFYTTNEKEIGTTTPGTRGIGGYYSEGIAGHIVSPERFKTLYTSSTPTCHLSLAGNPRFLSRFPVKCSPNEQKLAVRCCHPQFKVSMAQYGCNKDKTYDEANAICKSKGLSLCSLDQIKKCNTCGTGCGYDAARIWTSSTNHVPNIRAQLRCDVGSSSVANTTSAIGSMGHELILRDYVDGATNIQFIDQSLVFSKDGTVKEWNIFAHRPGTVKLQVWRIVQGERYKLIGETEINVSQTGVLKYPLPSFSEIQVEAGDVVGWRHTGAGVISFAMGGPPVRWFYGNPVGVMGEVTFSSGQNRQYSISVTCFNACSS
eukprot:c21803_g1_i3.p1 GENE.c21803_g1_i3~~c21803_g1_i3.p1  ORF type:complete len:1064 (-),score=458.95 c21803_g1_i3:71-3262(-)